MTKIAPTQYLSETAVVPGETIRDILADMGMTQAELAARMKRPANKINEIIQGKKEITVETALELELTLGLPATFWMNLEKNYQLTKARLAEDGRLAEEAVILKKFPVKEMCRFGWIQKRENVRLQVRELLGFFGITSFTQLSEIQSLAPAWRKGGGGKACAYALSAWLRKGVLEASKVSVKKFDPKGLKASIATIRGFTLLPDFHDSVVGHFASHGVALVYVPHLPKSYVNGAAYWQNEKPIVQLSLRYSYSDIVWFNLFHELGHVLLHSNRKNKAFIDDTIAGSDSFKSDDPKREEEANKFAQESLIPPSLYAKLIGSEFERPAVLRELASEIGVHPGVLVGRLHHEDLLHPSRLNDLRDKLEFKNEGDSRKSC
jgi:addiction module HigA family antidote